MDKEPPPEKQAKAKPRAKRSIEKTSEAYLQLEEKIDRQTAELARAFDKATPSLDSEAMATLREKAAGLSPQGFGAGSEFQSKLQELAKGFNSLDSLSGVIDLAADSTQRLQTGLAQAYIEPQTYVLPPPSDALLREEVQKLGTVMVASLEHLQLSATLTQTLVRETELGRRSAERTGNILNRLTFALVVLTVILALPEVAHLWNDWIVPAYELVQRSIGGN
jgi:hypothetical protein